MKKYVFLFSSFISLYGFAQPSVLPGAKQTTPIAITGATVHVGNGEVLPMRLSL